VERRQPRNPPRPLLPRTIKCIMMSISYKSLCVQTKSVFFNTTIFNGNIYIYNNYLLSNTICVLCIFIYMYCVFCLFVLVLIIGITCTVHVMLMHIYMLRSFGVCLSAATISMISWPVCSRVRAMHGPMWVCLTNKTLFINDIMMRNACLISYGIPKSTHNNTSTCISTYFFLFEYLSNLTCSSDHPRINCFFPFLRVCHHTYA
jgi:hypothetical protein